MVKLVFSLPSQGCVDFKQKWWSSGAGDPRCKIYIVMGKSDPHNKDPYKQQSVILVPANTPGLTINRMLSVYGFDDAPHGHGHITFNNVRVPASNMVLGPGRGFEIIQGRLGPGRIHHAMRAIGAVSFLCSLQDLLTKTG
jgi:acyl-CoA dehydrogenase